jgi:hypothetical protein
VDEEALPTTDNDNATFLQLTSIAVHGGIGLAGRRKLAGADVSVTFADMVPASGK